MFKRNRYCRNRIQESSSYGSVGERVGKEPICLEIVNGQLIMLNQYRLRNIIFVYKNLYYN